MATKLEIKLYQKVLNEMKPDKKMEIIQKSE